MSSLPASMVYKGYWVDYSKGSTLGATLTLKDLDGTILVAFVAGLVSLTGGHLWRIMATSFYFSQASTKPQDGLYQQQQVVMRNVPSPVKYALDSLRVVWYWRRQARKSYLRSLLPFLVAFSCCVGFLAAGIFTAHILSSSNIDVLISSPNCSYWNASAGNLDLAFSSSVIPEAFQFARKCYNSTGSDPSCDIFVKQELPLGDTRSAPCPFQTGCLGVANSPAIQLDTGLLDSNDDFGLNAPPKDRIKLRKQTTCAPVAVDKYLSLTSNFSTILNGYGNVLPQEDAWLISVTTENPFIQSTYKSNRTYDYQLDCQSTQVPPPLAPELILPDGDTVVFVLLTNSVNLAQPCNDPVFAAHKQVGSTPDQIVYYPDNAAALIGCSEQYQICNTATPNKCTALSSAGTAFSQAGSLGLNNIQEATVRLFDILINQDLINVQVVVATDGPFLATSAQGFTGLIEYLPDNQWEIEVQGWVNIALATLQFGVTEIAQGPAVDNPSLASIIVPPEGAAQHQLCQSQKAKAPNGFSNANVFGMSFAIAICGLIILTDLFLPSIIRALAGGKNKQLAVKLKCWDQDGVLQLQRKLYEALGQGDWKNASNDIPITAQGDCFANLSCFKLDLSRQTTAVQGSDDDDDNERGEKADTECGSIIHNNTRSLGALSIIDAAEYDEERALGSVARSVSPATGHDSDVDSFITDGISVKDQRRVSLRSSCTTSSYPSANGEEASSHLS